MSVKPILIESSKGKPFTAWYEYKPGVVTMYDVDYCRRDKTLYYEGAGGGSTQNALYLEHRDHNEWWIAPGYRVDGNIKNQVKRLNPKYAADVGTWGVESRCEYCEICKDYIPLIDPCEHITGYDTEAE